MEMEKEMVKFNEKIQQLEEENNQLNKEKQNIILENQKLKDGNKRKEEEINNYKNEFSNQIQNLKNVHSNEMKNQKQYYENEINNIKQKLNDLQLKEMNEKCVIALSEDFDNLPPEKKDETISQIGKMIKDQIENEVKTNPENFLNADEILAESMKNTNQKKNYGMDNDRLYFLGALSKSLTNVGLFNAIEKKSSDKAVMSACLQFIASGKATQPKYEFKFDFGAERNNQLLTDKDERLNFHNQLKNNLSEFFNTPVNTIHIINPRKGNNTADIMFDEIIPDKNRLQKFIKKQGNILSVEEKLLLEACKLCPEMFDSRGNNQDGGWAPKGEIRGGEIYYPPYGWRGYGLKVSGVYDKGNDQWLGIPGTFAVAYHGIRKGALNVEEIVNRIVTEGIKKGENNAYANHIDIRHPGKICGNGVYLSPRIEISERFTSEVKFKNKKFKIAFMCRVNPKKIRQPAGKQEYWILNGNKQEIRPYRILIKEE